MPPCRWASVLRIPSALLVLSACGFAHGSLDTISDGNVDTVDAHVAACTTWCLRQPITILGSHVRGGPHVRFVALIAWGQNAALAQHARSDGLDLRFMAGDGTTMLPYERVTYDGATGALQAWVQVPSIDASADVRIYLEYGNQNATDQQDRAATWPANVVGVWHLEDGSDSTGNGNDAQSVNGATIGDPKGYVGRGASFDGLDDRLLVPDSPSLDSTAGQATISLWINFTDASALTRQFIMVSSNNFTLPKSSFEWTEAVDGSNYFYPRRGDGDLAYDEIGPAFTDGEWHHAALKLDFSTKQVGFIIDGVQQTLTTNNAQSMWVGLANPDDWLWGSHPLYNAPFAGSMDEIRVTTALRGIGWIQTEYENQRDPSGFIRVDPEEPAP